MIPKVFEKLTQNLKNNNIKLIKLINYLFIKINH